MMAVKCISYDDIQSRNSASLFAPPIAWAVADFTSGLILDQGAIPPLQTAIIVASDECSMATIAELSRTVSQGFISPLRFAGSSPSIIVGLAALQHGIRGPSLCLTMSPKDACPAIYSAIDYWLRCNQIEAVIAIAHDRLEENRHVLKGFIARSSGDDLREHVFQLGRQNEAMEPAGIIIPREQSNLV
jgi:hypothetical protein